MAKSRPLPDWLPYVAPMVVFLAITAGLEGNFPQYYPLIYMGKVLVVGSLLWVFRCTWKDYYWEPKTYLIAAVIGLATFALWIGLEQIKYPHVLGTRTAYNPWKEIPEDGLRMAFLATRFFGLLLLVPWMEEIFWRSFVLRYATKPDFLSLKLDEFSTQALLIMAGLFGLAHPEWLPAVLTAVIYAELLRRTKSLSACFVAHAVTNLALGIYVVTQRQWQFW